MCGICGFIHKKKENEQTLYDMNQSIDYRGPNDEGYFLKDIESEYQLGLAHKRLSILDLSPLGHQPMFDNDNTIGIVFNGEIYNFQSIKQDLIKLGYSFKSNCDTEVIIYSYKEWGIDCVKKFNGMFAIAIYDRNENSLYLIRDRIGVKPLYYYYNGGDLVFASELKPIMKYPYFKKNIDLEALNLYLYHQYITAPYTIFENTHKLRPGYYLKFTNGNIEETKYWSIEEKYLQSSINEGYREEDYVNKLEKLLMDSVKIRMISDVPIGAFLSGGIDSSTVVALMQKQSSRPIKTFTIGFEEEKYNEANEAKKIAEYLNTNHNELYVPMEKTKEMLLQIPKYYDEPFADNSQIPTMLVSRLAKEQVTVSLSGDGGDELFCGYNTYDADMNFQKYKRISKIISALYDPFESKFKNDNINRKILKLFTFRNDDEIINSDYICSKLYLDGLVKLPYKISNKYYKSIDFTEEIKEKHMMQDISTYLPDDILTKVDRATMSVSLEGRNPILDYRVVEFALKCPLNLKYKDGVKKYILKEVLYKHVPHELVDGPKKGFAIPVYEWLHTDLNCYIEKYLNKNYIAKQGIFNVEKLEQLKAKFYSANDIYFDRLIWSILVFQLWYEEYMD